MKLMEERKDNSPDSITGTGEPTTRASGWLAAPTSRRPNRSRQERGLDMALLFGRNLDETCGTFYETNKGFWLAQVVAFCST